MEKALFTLTLATLSLSAYIYHTIDIADQKESTNDVTYQSVKADHEWVIEFDGGINEALLNGNSIYVTDDQ